MKEEFEQFSDDKSILLHVTKVLLKTQDPDSLVCSSSVSVNRHNVDTLSDKEILDTFEDVYSFSCSFLDHEIA